MSTTMQRALAALAAVTVAILTGAGIAAITADPPAGADHLSPALAVTGALTAAAVTAVILLGTRGSGPPYAPHPPDAHPDRAALIQACVYVRDRTTSRALSDRLGSALTAAGVTTLEPTGTRFDPAHHEAGGTAPTTDHTLAGTIAGIEAPGYADRDGHILRPPIVTVYHLSDQNHGAHR